MLKYVFYDTIMDENGPCFSTLLSINMLKCIIYAKKWKANTHIYT